MGEATGCFFKVDIYLYNTNTHFIWKLDNLFVQMSISIQYTLNSLVVANDKKAPLQEDSDTKKVIKHHTDLSHKE